MASATTPSATSSSTGGASVRWTWSVSIILILIGGMGIRSTSGWRRRPAPRRGRAPGGGRRLHRRGLAVRGMFRPIADAFNVMAQRVHEHRLAQLKMAKELQASSAGAPGGGQADGDQRGADEAAAVEETRRTMVGAPGGGRARSPRAPDKVASSGRARRRARARGSGTRSQKLSAQSQKIRKITAIIQASRTRAMSWP